MKSLFVAILRKICRAGIIIPHRHKVLRSLVSELPPNAQPLCLTRSVEPFSAFKIASMVFAPPSVPPLSGDRNAMLSIKLLHCVAHKINNLCALKGLNILG